MDTPLNLLAATSAALFLAAARLRRRRTRPVAAPCPRPESEVTDEIQERFAPYRLLRALPTGGMCDLFLMVDPDGRHVVIKAQAPRWRDDPEARRLFRNEFRVLIALHERTPDAPAPKAIRSVPESAERSAYFVMEYVAGQRLDHLLAHCGPLDPGDLRRLACALCRALIAVHDAGFSHEDFNPQNLLVERRAERVVTARLIDFGVARSLPDRAQTSALESHYGASVFGTPAYMAPEKRTRGPISAQADLYSLGVVLFQAAMGRLPERNERRPERLGLDLALSDLVADLLAPDPAQRPPSARKAFDRISDTPSEKAVPAQPDAAGKFVTVRFAPAINGATGAEALRSPAVGATPQGVERLS